MGIGILFYIYNSSWWNWRKDYFNKENSKSFKIGIQKDCVKEKYDKKTFLENDIKHNELFFIDGSTPPDDIVE
jgi:hypothetical protein